MPYENIRDISKLTITPGGYYFLDANIWIYAIIVHLVNRITDRGNPIYTKLFDDLTQSTLKPKPRIIMCSILMSEITNTFLKKYALSEYLFENFKSKNLEVPHSFDYKRDYRKTEHFKEQYKLILEEIKTYHASIFLVDDGYSKMKPFQFAKNCPSSMDLNDYMYFLIAKELSATLTPFCFVTNDSDFLVNGFDIYTATRGLLDKAK